MYASPVIFPLSIVPAQYRWILLANPMTAVIESFRHMIFGVGHLSINAVVYSIMISCVIFFGGYLIFNHTEKDFIDST